MVKIGILRSLHTDEKSHTPPWEKVREHADNPDTHFIFSDEHPIIARYLNQIQYRKCTVYHTGTAPKHNIGKYTSRGGFVSYTEIRATIKEECDEIIFLD